MQTRKPALKADLKKYIKVSGHDPLYVLLKRSILPWIKTRKWTFCSSYLHTQKKPNHNKRISREAYFMSRKLFFDFLNITRYFLLFPKCILSWQQPCKNFFQSNLVAIQVHIHFCHCAGSLCSRTVLVFFKCYSLGSQEERDVLDVHRRCPPLWY